MALSRTWDSSYEADPADGDLASGGALDIRQVKVDIRERGEIDHSWAGDADDGKHKKVTFVDPLGAKPTQSNDETYLYTKDVSATSELFFEDENGNEIQLTSGGVQESEFASGTDMLFYENTAPTGWTIVTALDNSVVELTDGSANGGATGGAATGTVSTETFFARTATDSHTLTTNEIPSHTHNTWSASGSFSGAVGSSGGILSGANPSQATGGGAGHTHAIDCRLRRAQCIIASKD